MTSEVAGTPVWTWRRLLAVTAAKALLVGLVGLAAWGALPAALGWHPTTVSSGSMMPRLHVGDVAVSRPLHGQAPPLQSVLLYDDPDHTGRLRMHRFIRLQDDGLMVTRGDANPAEDSTPIGLSAVRGIGTLRVPWVALPIVWLREGRWLFLGLTAVALALTLVVASSGRDATFDDDRDDEEEPDEPDDPPASDQPAHDQGVTASAEPEGRRQVVRRYAGVVAAGLLASVLAVPLATTPAFARFGDTTATTAALGATPYFSCAAAVDALDPYL